MGDLFYRSEKEIDCILLTAVVADLLTSPVTQHSIFSPITIGPLTRYRMAISRTSRYCGIELRWDRRNFEQTLASLDSQSAVNYLFEG
jgi:hypothetical protein